MVSAQGRILERIPVWFLVLRDSSFRSWSYQNIFRRQYHSSLVYFRFFSFGWLTYLGSRQAGSCHPSTKSRLFYLFWFGASSNFPKTSAISPLKSAYWVSIPVNSADCFLHYFSQTPAAYSTYSTTYSSNWKNAKASLYPGLVDFHLLAPIFLFHQWNYLFFWLSRPFHHSIFVFWARIQQWILFLSSFDWLHFLF